jgi:transposase, IS5 family
MPIDNITEEGRQMQLFQLPLREELDSTEPIYILRNIIDFESVEKELSKFIEIHRWGRERKSIRALIGLQLLQAMNGWSDAQSSDELRKGAYCQYFCGYEYSDYKNINISESVIRRFRQDIGEEGHKIILQELVKVGLKSKVCAEEDLKNIIIDTTVQEKNVQYPMDDRLLKKSRIALIKLAKRYKLKLNNTYDKICNKYQKQLFSYRGKQHSNKKQKIRKKIKTITGRCIREVKRGIEKLGIELNECDKRIIERAEQVYNQSCLSSEDKKKYKKEGNKIIYSFHAPEVECIAKGKAHKEYEFGNKVGFAISGRGNLVIGVASFHENPYDGHTLNETIEIVEKTANINSINKAYVDRGYQGHDYKHKSRVYTAYCKKKLTKEDEVMQKRRNAIEPIIGHMKNYGRLGRNFLKGVIGDKINPIISSFGINMRCICNTIKAKFEDKLYKLYITSLFPT